MTITYWLQLVGAAVVGAVFTLLVQLILQRTGHRRDMAGERWKLQFSRLVALKDATGYLHERIIDMVNSIRDSRDGEARRLWLAEIREQQRALEKMLGQFAEDDTLAEAIRSFAHTARVMLADNEKYGKIAYATPNQRIAALTVLDEDYYRVLNAVNSLLEGTRQTPILLAR